LHAPKGRQAPKVRQEPVGRLDTKSRKEQPVRKDHRADEYTVSSFLDAQYMFFENVDRTSTVLPVGSGAPKGDSSLTYALHVKIEWEGADSEGKPYEPTWEVADQTTVQGEAWRAFVSQKRRLSGKKNWSIADIPFEHNARPGKRITG